MLGHLISYFPRIWSSVTGFRKPELVVCKKNLGPQEVKTHHHCNQSNTDFFKNGKSCTTLSSNFKRLISKGTEHAGYIYTWFLMFWKMPVFLNPVTVKHIEILGRVFNYIYGGWGVNLFVSWKAEDKWQGRVPTIEVMQKCPTLSFSKLFFKTIGRKNTSSAQSKPLFNRNQLCLNCINT